ncbi:GYDIA family GHMP kinase [Blattabacterium cuenoti]|uniref:GYDIA family GHMP kinase n=1 Tax=Blattabacterium cuenoti TaxID=1653831 RepID=UPI00163CF666|nr:GYDIA family GHMP kinase [Blattabacterium cuenoti]
MIPKFKLKNFFHTHGKLLLTGEYFILYGSYGLAVPTIRGQSLTTYYGKIKNKGSVLRWKSLNEKNQPWFKCIFLLPSLDICYNTEKKTALKLRNLLLESRKLQKKFLKDSFEIYVKTKLEFPINWGLGSSSTLINNIARWAKVNPYGLLEKNFLMGSGYDIACGSNKTPILYRIKNKKPHIIPINFNPPFKEKLFFLHLNKKQNTFEGIRFFLSKKKNISREKINSISFITQKITFCKTLKEFEELLIQHEIIIAKILDLPTVKEIYFTDYLGVVKSLGAWGGDFVLISYRNGMKKYFSNKGYHTILSFDEMIF